MVGMPQMDSIGALKDEFPDFVLFRFASVLAPKTLQNGIESGPRGAPGCPGGGPGCPGGGSGRPCIKNAMY